MYTILFLLKIFLQITEAHSDNFCGGPGLSISLHINITKLRLKK